MKTIIAGSRSITDYEEVLNAIELSGFKITCVVSGKAKGIDLLGERYADTNHLPIDPYPVSKEEWRTIGKHAGHLRNEKMAQNAEALIAVWDGVSKGTLDMIKRAKKHGLKVFVYIAKPTEPTTSLDLVFDNV